MFEQIRSLNLGKLIRNNIFLIVVSIISIIVVFSPNIQQDIVVGSDYTFHLIRIETLASALKYGIFPVKFHPDLCYSFGYGVGFFYSNFFLYIPAILINMGLSLEVSYKILAGLTQIGIFAAAFYAAYKLTQNKYASLFTAVMYLFSITVLESFYRHFTLGRSTAMIFLPLAIAGMYLIVNTGKHSGLFVLGFTGLIYSHILSTVLATLACLLIALAYHKKWMNRVMIWKKLIGSTLIVLLLTSAFWIPMMEQWAVQTYRVSQPWTYVDDNVIRIYDLLNDNGVGILLLGITIFIGLQLVSPPPMEKWQL